MVVIGPVINYPVGHAYQRDASTDFFWDASPEANQVSLLSQHSLNTCLEYLVEIRMGGQLN